MKHLILTLSTLLFTISSFSQSSKNNITVNGLHTYATEAEYTSKTILSLTSVYDTQSMSFDEIKKSYMGKLEKVGISSDQLVFDDLQYAFLGYDKQGTVIIFKSKSLTELQKFLSVKSIGVTQNEIVLKQELTDTQMADFSKLAYDDAKTKASAIASKIGRKIGEAIYISDTNLQKISESVYYGSSKETLDYHISVSFELL